MPAVRGERRARGRRSCARRPSRRPGRRGRRRPYWSSSLGTAGTRPPSGLTVRADVGDPQRLAGRQRRAARRRRPRPVVVVPSLRIARHPPSAQWSPVDRVDHGDGRRRTRHVRQRDRLGAPALEHPHLGALDPGRQLVGGAHRDEQPVDRVRSPGASRRGRAPGRPVSPGWPPRSGRRSAPPNWVTSVVGARRRLTVSPPGMVDLAVVQDRRSCARCVALEAPAAVGSAPVAGRSGAAPPGTTATTATAAAIAGRRRRAAAAADAGAARPRTSSRVSGASYRRVHAAVQLPAAALLGRWWSWCAHRSSSRGFEVERGCAARSAASARLAWDFTVPTEMPSTSAVSASLSSS